MTPELIYCAGGSKRYMEIAVQNGYLPGARLPSTVHFPLHFADQNYHNPNRDAYMKAVAEHRPRIATALDWEREDQLQEVLSWAEELAQYVETVVIVPKVINGISKLPHTIAGKNIRLGYSVPTRYGATNVPIWEFNGRTVHLLGGNPQNQMHLSRYMDVRSADGNMAMLMANKFCAFWVPGNHHDSRNRWWPSLKNTGKHTNVDAPYKAFALSCANITQAWRDHNVRTTP